MNMSINTLNDDLLLQIFIRLVLHDCRTVIRCSIVCKRWFSLIHSIDYHNRKRKQYQTQSESSSPFTFIFRGGYNNGGVAAKISEPFYEYLPKKPQILHKIKSSSPLFDGTYLEFLPWRNVHIFSSFNDLLLFSPDDDDDHPEHILNRLMICDRLTRQWLELPPLPKALPFSGCNAGLVCKPDNQHQLNQYRYRVVLLFTLGNLSFATMIFSSESDRWSESTFGQYLDSSPPVASDGMLHLLEMTNRTDQIVPRIVAFDPFKDANHPELYRFVGLPSYIQYGFGVSRGLSIRLGLVRGRLRLSLLHGNNTDDLVLNCTGCDHLVLKVWELYYDDETHQRWGWTLVHNVKLKRWTTSEELPVFIAFHPDNENVIFLLRNCGNHLLLYQYNIGEEKMTKVGEIPEVPSFLQVYTLVNPLWPVTIPMLPSI